MNRGEFEVLRDLQDKRITSDIRLARSAATNPVLSVDNVVIANSSETELRLNIHYNPETGAKTINVCAVGVGPICRLDVDGPVHRPAGRSHKHSLQTEHCPRRNLRDNVLDRPELAGKKLRDVFEIFCRMASIVHTGILIVPDDVEP